MILLKLLLAVITVTILFMFIVAKLAEDPEDNKEAPEWPFS